MCSAVVEAVVVNSCSSGHCCCCRHACLMLVATVVLFVVLGLGVLSNIVRSGVDCAVMGIVVHNRSLQNRCATYYRIVYKGN